jgi:HCNGP-like protein
MSALVGYESSGDEDAEQAAPAIKAPAPSNETPVENGDKQQKSYIASLRTADDDSLPLIGPTIPDGLPDHDDGGLGTPQLPQGLSEQDLIRYLTQASHPMTALPPSPPGSPNPQIETKFKRFLELKSKGLHFNEDLAKKTTFRNPGLFSTLMERAGIDEDAQYATSLPASVWDPQLLPPAAYKEELLKSQQSIRDQQTAQKKQASAAGKRMIEFTSAGRSGASSRTSTPG